MIKKPGPITRTACLLVLLLLAAACGQIDAQDPLSHKERSWLEEHGPVSVATDFSYHPFSFVSNTGQPEGICVDMWKVMAEKLRFQVKFLTMADSKEIADLRQGTLDSSTGMFPLPERRLYLDFSNPFYPVTTAIFLNIGSRPASGLDGLHGVPTGAVKGDSGAAALIKAGIKPILYDTYEACVQALGANRVEAAVMDDPVMLYWRDRLKLGDRISWAPGNAVVERSDLALPVKKGNEVLLSILNKGLALVSGAEIQRIRERYIR
ncbi:MAG: transporter substrate-binding domain-containing protein [Desulfarculaceae bacterium]|nr:transporter substrate-binding domain-containing protein [Desulfarculaceae bacterium]